LAGPHWLTWGLPIGCCRAFQRMVGGTVEPPASKDGSCRCVHGFRKVTQSVQYIRMKQYIRSIYAVYSQYISSKFELEQCNVSAWSNTFAVYSRYIRSLFALYSQYIRIGAAQYIRMEQYICGIFAVYLRYIRGIFAVYSHGPGMY